MPPFFCRPAGGGTFCTFPALEKYQKNAQGGFAALEDPLITGVICFPSDDTLVVLYPIPSLVRQTSAATHLFYRWCLLLRRCFNRISSIASKFSCSVAWYPAT